MQMQIQTREYHRHAATPEATRTRRREKRAPWGSNYQAPVWCVRLTKASGPDHPGSGVNASYSCCGTCDKLPCGSMELRILRNSVAAAVVSLRCGGKLFREFDALMRVLLIGIKDMKGRQLQRGACFAVAEAAGAQIAHICTLIVQRRADHTREQDTPAQCAVEIQLETALITPTLALVLALSLFQALDEQGHHSGTLREADEPHHWVMSA